MRNAKEDIDYYNRKFKFNLSGRSTTGQYRFQFNPPNETANSNNFNQCLIKISKFYVHNQMNTVAGGATLGSGFSDVWNNFAGFIQTQGIHITTNIACNNSHHLNDLGHETRAGYSILMPNVCKNGSFPYPQAAAIDGLAGQSALGINRGPANADRINEAKGMIWEYQDDRPIEDAGVICGNPFGKELVLETRSPHDGIGGARGTGDIIILQDISGAAGSINNSIGVEIEVLMLPNPTPRDR